ncbi:hypothetical protein BHE74_00048802 [Ensete ventricosum]|nr:hypothetical protein BHE74_00048802 [Ensete ventricosum]
MGQGRGVPYYNNGRGARQCRTRSSLSRILDRLSTWSLGLTWFPPKYYCDCPSGVDLEESDRHIRYPITRRLRHQMEKDLSSTDGGDDEDDDEHSGATPAVISNGGAKTKTV